MMGTTRPLLCLAVVMLTLAACSAAYPADTLWYRGYFDGEVEITDDGWGLYEYTPVPRSVVPRPQPRYSITTRCWSVGPFRYCRTEVVENPEVKAEDDKVYSRYPLSGQYWHKKPPSYSLTRGTSLPPFVRYDRERY